MNGNAPEDLPKQIQQRIRDTPEAFVDRERHLLRKYQTGEEVDHESPKAIQKEIDGMCRFLRALAADERFTDDIAGYAEVYESVTDDLIELEHQIVEDLPNISDA
jgi:hypothetical protein